MKDQNAYVMDAVARGYRFECSCGELSKTIAIARACRKCRTYAPELRCTEVYDLATGEFVWKATASTPPADNHKVTQTFKFADSLSAEALRQLRESLPQ